MSRNVADVRQRPVNRSLDVARGIASVLVVLGHARFFAETAVGSLGDHTDLGRLILAPTSFAQESVSVFFVLSGFLVGGQVIRDTARGSFSWRGYMSKRLSRLWTVLVPGLVLTIVLDQISRDVNAVAFGQIGTNGSSGPFTLFCNVLFLQRSRCTPFGSNESLWSISYEFWFYVLFAGATCLVFSALRNSWRQLVVAAVVCAASILIFGPDLFRLLPAWLLGVLVAVFVRSRSAANIKLCGRNVARVLILFSATICMTGFVVSNIFSLPEVTRFLIVGGASAPFLTALVLWAPANQSRTLRSAAWLGNISYSSYVYHAPILKLLVVCCAGAFVSGGVIQSAPVYLVAVVAYMSCIPLWWLTERNTNRVRRRIDRILRVSRER